MEESRNSRGARSSSNGGWDKHARAGGAPGGGSGGGGGGRSSAASSSTDGSCCGDGGGVKRRWKPALVALRLDHFLAAATAATNAATALVANPSARESAEVGPRASGMGSGDGGITAATSCHCLPWPLPLSYVSGSRVWRSLSRRSSFARGLSSGAAPVAELAVLGLEVLVLAVLVLVGGSRSRRSSFARGLSGGAAPVAEPGVLLLEVPVNLLLLVVPLVDAEVLGVDSSGSSVHRRLSLPQQLREWAVLWGSPGGGAWGTCAGGGEAPGGVEATSLGAVDSASTGAEPEEALHTFTLDSEASRCFFRVSTTITPLIVPVPVTLADPSGGPVFARGATVLPCLAAPSGLLIGLHLYLFAKNLVATSVLQD
ncbi:unnamed protein product [Closterium sp. NIES-54]